MSKITPKNLHYDSSLPPFLARLQANNASSDGRHEFSIARPKKARNADEDAEDEPVYFNEESGETLTKSEWEAKEAADEVAKEQLADAEGKTVGKPEGGGGATGGVKEGKEKIAAIGAAKKRKAGKVVGAEEGDDRDEEEAAAAEAGKKASITPQAQAQASKTEGKKGEKTKPAKKAKKIKLSFDE